MPHAPRSLYDVITIGDAMVDLFFQIHEASVTCQKKPGSCLLCLEYGEKIPVQSVIKVAGAGNASNAAIGARRLGMKSAIVSILGKDDMAQEILKNWKQERIQTTYVVQDAKHETSLAAVLQFQGDRTILLHNQPRTYILPRIPAARWIYYTALGPKHERLEKQLLRYLKQHPQTHLLFNPGPHHIRRGIKSLGSIIARSDLLIVNKEEAEHMLATEASPRILIDQLLKIGARQVIITDGSQGSWAGDGEHLWHCPIFPGPIVDRTGAGDSYAIAVLFALFQNKSLPEALRYGTAHGWSVVQHIGPHIGLLNQKQMQKVLQKFRAIQPRIIR